MFKKRMMTALLMIAIFLGLLFYLSPMQFYIVMGVVGAWAAWEWTTLVATEGRLTRWLYVVATSVIFLKALFVPIVWILSVSITWWIVAAGLVISYPRWRIGCDSLLITRLGMGWLVLTPCWVALNDLRSQADGLSLLFFLFVLVWGVDSTAYFVGSFWGKHALAPAVSPKKSVEGVMGACIFAICWAGAIIMWHGLPFSWQAIGLLTVMTTVAAVIGDLFESMLKREAHLKDINQWLPGHGGLLDRIDSLTAAAPCFTLGIWLLR